MNTPEAIKAAFPSRPLQIKNVRNGMSRLAMILMTLFAAALFLSAIWQISVRAPGILDDYKISKNPVAVEGVVGGSCKIRMKIFMDCIIPIDARGEVVERTYHLFRSSTDNALTILTSKDDPSLLSTSLGVEKLTNQIALLVFGTLFLVGIGGVVLWSVLISVRLEKEAKALLEQMSGTSLTPVLIPAKIIDTTKMLVVQYKWQTAKGLKKQAGFFKVKDKEKPLIVPTNEQDKTYVLGVTTSQQTPPVLLDESLNRLDLTEQEKQVLLESISSLS